LAVLDMNAADGVQAQFPQIEKWYIGGHSLGGAMASSYAAKHADEFDGVVLLGAYATEDIQSLNVISLYGSEDKVMNKEKYDEYISNLPADFTEIVIEGGCHAGFGMYGPQDGDGTPAITAAEQIKLTSAAVFDWLPG
jgi:S-formylglutathione hydrolase FrmB